MFCYGIRFRFAIHIFILSIKVAKQTRLIRRTRATKSHGTGRRINEIIRDIKMLIMDFKMLMAVECLLLFLFPRHQKSKGTFVRVN